MAKQFARELTEILEGPPKISQADLCRKTKIWQSKMCRLLRDEVEPTPGDLHAIVQFIPDKESKVRLLNAYVRDKVFAEDLSLLRNAKDPWGGLETNRMSRKGKDALNAILRNRLEDGESFFINMADSWDLKY